MRSRKDKLKGNWRALKARVRRMFHLIWILRPWTMGKHIACTLWADKECVFVACSCGNVYYTSDDPEMKEYIEGAIKYWRKHALNKGKI